MKKLLLALSAALILAGSAIVVNAALPTGCESETGLLNRTDILMCQPWEDQNWYAGWWRDQGDTGDFLDGRRFHRYAVTAGDMGSAEIISQGCLVGSCLRINMLDYLTAQGGGWLGINWNIPGQNGCQHDQLGCVPQQEVSMRYYLKLAPNFDPEGVGIGTGDPSGGGGKFPGLADATNGFQGNPSIQCGNGGEAPNNGTECWSHRLTFQPCFATFNGVHNVCAENGNPSASTRFGGYPYMYTGFIGGTRFGAAYWDDDGRGSYAGPCSIATGQDGIGFGGGKNGPYASPPFCGAGVPGLVNNRWYMIELHIKMNDPGVNNGVIEGWIDGVLRYQKLNANFRNPGHNNIGIRQFWFDVFTGGTGVGMKQNTWVLFDQAVVAAGGRIGPWSGSAPGKMVNVSQDPGVGTGGFTRAHYQKNLGCYLSMFGTGGPRSGDNSIRCQFLTQQSSPTQYGVWMTLFPNTPDNNIAITKTDNYASLFLPWRGLAGELWYSGGSYLSPQESGIQNATISGIMSFDNCVPTPTPNCAQWVRLSRRLQWNDAFDGIVKNAMFGNEATGTGLAWATDSAWACNEVVRKCMGGWGYTNANHYIIEDNVSRAQGSICNTGAASGTEPMIMCALPANPKDRAQPPALPSDDLPVGAGTTPGTRVQAMNVLSPGPDANRCFYIVGTLAFTAGNYYNIRDFWQYNCNTMTWTQLTPPPRITKNAELSTPLMVYDSGRNQQLLQLNDQILAYPLNGQDTWYDITPAGGTGFDTFNSYGAYVENAEIFIIQDGNQTSGQGASSYGVRGFTPNANVVGTPVVGFAVASSSGGEAVTSVSIPVTLSQPAAGVVTVQYAATSGTATQGVDYNLTSGLLTFQPGVTSQSIPFTVINDSTAEGNETIIISLSNASGAILGASSHTYTIVDNDSGTPTGVLIGSNVPIAGGTIIGN